MGWERREGERRRGKEIYQKRQREKQKKCFEKDEAVERKLKDMANLWGRKLAEYG